MRQTLLLMNMPITVEIDDPGATQESIDKVFAYFVSIDERFSVFKESSEISKINRGELAESQYSADMKTILALCEQTKQETYGYFDIWHDGHYDPSGIVKGWAIYNAAHILEAEGYSNFYVDAGGDVQIAGLIDGQPWRVGIRNPFNSSEIVKVLLLTNQGIATSGTEVRGQHIFNPHNPEAPIVDIVSITIIGPNVYEADRFATAAFAMGERGIYFVEEMPDLEGYMIDTNGIATSTSGFERYVLRS
jgi:FAD:protein FMN transferase